MAVASSATAAAPLTSQEIARRLTAEDPSATEFAEKLGRLVLHLSTNG